MSDNMPTTRESHARKTTVDLPEIRVAFEEWSENGSGNCFGVQHVEYGFSVEHNSAASVPELAELSARPMDLLLDPNVGVSTCRRWIRVVDGLYFEYATV